ncbi:MAG: outer membrane beta-barrel protein [Bacteroidales bacterium]|nr:outer membrane beta-barrel protein [Bacteroidales bacterium]
MKKILFVSMMLLAAVAASAKEDWRGKVVDEKGAPVAYANVAVLSRADSTVVCGAVTGEDGTFSIVTRETDGIMMVAMLGYRTVYLAPVDGMVITLADDTAMLEGAVATAVMPKTKLTGEGIQTGVRGSVLENVGSANDVLAKTPGIVKGSNGIEVIGKGAPLVYINGRRVTDATELDRLQSNEIQSVEVIANPGAQYDATVRSVVRIRTIRRQGEGFGFNFNASDAQSLRWSKGNDPFGTVGVNYRTGGVDLFGGVTYAGNSSRQLSEAEATSYFMKDGKVNELRNVGDIDAQYLGGSYYGNAGVNWQLADNHFLGGKVEWATTAGYDVNTLVTSDVFENGIRVDQLSTRSLDRLGDKRPYDLGANLYYNGVLGEKTGVDVNLDYYGTSRETVSSSDEASTMTQDATVRSFSDNASRMYAAKAVLSRPVWIGQLQAGTEETFTRRRDEYRISGVPIPSSSAQVKEDNYAAFASYGFMLPKLGMVNAGLRYEYVHYAYEDALTPSANISRDYGNLFPTVSWAGAAGPVQLMLNYSAKTRRPNYSLLSGAIRYNSKYIWQSGNAQLQPEISHNVGLTAVWKWITFIVNYTRTDDAMMSWSSPYVREGVADGVVLVKPRNIDSPFRMMAAYVNLTPTVGPWTINYTVGAMPQWLTLSMDDPRVPGGKRSVSFNDKVSFVAQLFNTLTLKGGWQLELGGLVQTPGYSQNLYMKSLYCDVTAAVQKTLLKDGSLILRLEGADLLGMARMDVDTDFGSHYINQTNLMDTQKVKVSVRYSFNTAQSKYRGTGAGSDARSRM